MNQKRQLSCFHMFQESCRHASTRRELISFLGIVTHSCHWQWHTDEMVWSFVIGHRSKHYIIVTKRYLSFSTNQLNSVCVDLCIYTFFFVVSVITFYQVIFCCGQKTFLSSVLSLEILASFCFLLNCGGVQLNICYINGDLSEASFCTNLCWIFLQ